MAKSKRKRKKPELFVQVSMVDDTRLELVTSRTSSGCATSCANRPSACLEYTCFSSLSSIFCAKGQRFSPGMKKPFRRTPCPEHRRCGNEGSLQGRSRDAPEKAREGQAPPLRGECEAVGRVRIGGTSRTPSPTGVKDRKSVV